MPRKQDKAGTSRTNASAVNSADSVKSPRDGWTRYRKPAAAALVVAALLAVLVWDGSQPGMPANAGQPPTGANSTNGGREFLSMPAAASTASMPQSAAVQRQQLVQQVVQADQALCQYQSGTRYPPGSRPVSQHPDQIYPNQPVAESHAMRKPDGTADKTVQIATTQSHVYLAAGEKAVFTVRASDAQGQPLTLQIDKAVAKGLSFAGQKESAALALNMNDSGQDGDTRATDGIYSATLQPAQSGFASFHGTVRTEVSYTVAGKPGRIFFDVVYSPELPATWVAGVRESNEGGQLRFTLRANVRLPGRYLVSARLDDAQGKPFALLSFNDVLPQGLNDIPLIVAGNLLRDQQAAMPLRLRDVDAYLLRENVDPDRLLMPRLEGQVAVSKTYALNAFSTEEWQSEERQRYLTEFGKDLQLAKNALRQLDPDVERNGYPQSECRTTGSSNAAAAIAASTPRLVR